MSKFISWLQRVLKLRQRTFSETHSRAAHARKQERLAQEIARQSFIAAHRRFIL